MVERCHSLCGNRSGKAAHTLAKHAPSAQSTRPARPRMLVHHPSHPVPLPPLLFVWLQWCRQSGRCIFSTRCSLFFSRPLGAPLGAATLSQNGTVWTRSFAHGAVATFNIKTQDGSVAWGQPNQAAKKQEHGPFKAERTEHTYTWDA